MAHCVPLDFVRYSLATKAVGLGEAHDDPRARKVILEWITLGLVTDLVLELGWDEDVGGDDFLVAVGYCDAKWKNPVGLVEVIKHARSREVAVHAWDSGAGSNGVRNRAVIDKFRAHFGGGRFAVTKAPGCIILFGAEHFSDHASSLNRLLLGLYWSDLSR